MIVGRVANQGGELAVDRLFCNRARARKHGVRQATTHRTIAGEGELAARLSRRAGKHHVADRLWKGRMPHAIQDDLRNGLLSLHRFEARLIRYGQR
ncbi:hypothetical protein D9M73_113880 [compost metagenome]